MRIAGTIGVSVVLLMDRCPLVGFHAGADTDHEVVESHDAPVVGDGGVSERAMQPCRGCDVGDLSDSQADANGSERVNAVAEEMPSQGAKLHDIPFKVDEAGQAVLSQRYANLASSRFELSFFERSKREKSTDGWQDGCNDCGETEECKEYLHAANRSKEMLGGGALLRASQGDAADS